MKCPFKFFKYDFEGGEKCDPECAWNYDGECDPCGLREIAIELNELHDSVDAVRDELATICSCM